MKGRFLLHCSDPSNWRLRNLDEHPLDPGWEAGLYCCCHSHVRSRIDSGSIVFDVVVKDGKGVIRSAFTVARVQDLRDSRILYFDEFYFADNEPIELPEPYIQYRQMKLETWIRKYGGSSLWKEIIKRFTKYAKGQKPQSIRKRDWEHMIKTSSEIRRREG